MVGAGVVGASTAYQLARAGVRVTIVDHRVDGEATAAGAGIVGPWLSGTDDLTWQQIAYTGAAYLPSIAAELADATGADVGYARVGAFVAGTDTDELGLIAERLRDRAERWPQLRAVELVPAGDPQLAFPPLRRDLAAVWVEGAGRVDGRLLRAALLSAAEHHGAVRRTGSARLTTGPAVLVDGQPIGADAIVVAAGAWSAKLTAELGFSAPVYPQRGQIVHFELPDAADLSAQWPTVLPAGGPYLLGFPGGRVVAGATREPDAGFDYRVTAGGINEVVGSALRAAPGLAAATVLETRVGFRPCSVDDLPLLGTVPGHDNVIVATGLGATGLTIGPYLGRLAAELATGGSVELDLTPYRLDRSSVAAPVSPGADPRSV